MVWLELLGQTESLGLPVVELQLLFLPVLRWLESLLKTLAPEVESARIGGVTWPKNEERKMSVCKMYCMCTLKLEVCYIFHQ